MAALLSALTPTGATSLHALSSTAIALNTPNPTPEFIAHALIHHTSVSQTLSNHLAHVRTLQSYLDKQYFLLRSQLSELQSNPAFVPPPTLQRQTADQVRQTKHLRSKIRECEDKLSSLQHTQQHGRRGSTITPRTADAESTEAIAQMLEQQTRLEEIRRNVEGLEREVEVYGGLPADREAARKEVGKLEVELDNVRQRRDALFEGLVG
jgi:HAUS augmin-like complex subunit 1